MEARNLIRMASSVARANATDRCRDLEQDALKRVVLAGLCRQFTDQSVHA
jgi:hypothetical protein